jgi:LmbE family N-acetylglucosaminyl deacetylase
MKSIILIQIALMMALVPNLQAQQKNEQKLHVIIIGAHPDDADGAGGVAYKWAQLGYDVLMVSLTNGDAGISRSPQKNLQKFDAKRQERQGK